MVAQKILGKNAMHRSRDYCKRIKIWYNLYGYYAVDDIYGEKEI